MVNCNPDVVQRIPVVEQPFDDLETKMSANESTAAGCRIPAALRIGVTCALNELAVGDPSDLADRSAITYQLVRTESSEQAGLHGSAGRSGAVVTITSSARVVQQSRAGLDVAARPRCFLSPIALLSLASMLKTPDSHY